MMTIGPLQIEMNSTRIQRNQFERIKLLSNAILTDMMLRNEHKPELVFLFNFFSPKKQH